MHRGSTPTIRFDFEEDISKLTNINIAFAQNGNVIVEKFISDCDIQPHQLTVNFTEEETLKFKTDVYGSAYVEAQVKIGFGQKRVISNIMQLIIGPIIKDGPMEKDPYIDIVAVPEIRRDEDDKTLIVAETDQQAGIIKKDTHKETAVKATDLEPNLTPENVKKGAEVFGVLGVYEPKLEEKDVEYDENGAFELIPEAPVEGYSKVKVTVNMPIQDEKTYQVKKEDVNKPIELTPDVLEDGRQATSMKKATVTVNVDEAVNENITKLGGSVVVNPSENSVGVKSVNVVADIPVNNYGEETPVDIGYDDVKTFEPSVEGGAMTKVVVKGPKNVPLQENKVVDAVKGENVINPDAEFDGMKKATVNVKVDEAKEVNITKLNETVEPIVPAEGSVGVESVNVNVNIPVENPIPETLAYGETKTYKPTDGAAMTEVVVSAPPDRVIAEKGTFKATKSGVNTFNVKDDPNLDPSDAIAMKNVDVNIPIEDAKEVEIVKGDIQADGTINKVVSPADGNIAQDAITVKGTVSVNRKIYSGFDLKYLKDEYGTVYQINTPPYVLGERDCKIDTSHFLKDPGVITKNGYITITDEELEKGVFGFGKSGRPNQWDGKGFHLNVQVPAPPMEENKEVTLTKENVSATGDINLPVTPTDPNEAMKNVTVKGKVEKDTQINALRPVGNTDAVYKVNVPTPEGSLGFDNPTIAVPTQEIATITQNGFVELPQGKAGFIGKNAQGKLGIDVNVAGGGGGEDTLKAMVFEESKEYYNYIDTTVTIPTNAGGSFRNFKKFDSIYIKSIEPTYGLATTYLPKAHFVYSNNLENTINRGQPIIQPFNSYHYETGFSRYYFHTNCFRTNYVVAGFYYFDGDTTPYPNRKAIIDIGFANWRSGMKITVNSDIVLVIHDMTAVPKQNTPCKGLLVVPQEYLQSFYDQGFNAISLDDPAAQQYIMPPAPTDPYTKLVDPAAASAATLEEPIVDEPTTLELPPDDPAQNADGNK